MHDYMKALYHRFDSPTEQIELLEEQTDRIYKKLVTSAGGFRKCLTGSSLLEQLHVRLQTGTRHPSGTAGRPAAL